MVNITQETHASERKYRRHIFPFLIKLGAYQLEAWRLPKLKSIYIRVWMES